MWSHNTVQNTAYWDNFVTCALTGAKYALEVSVQSLLTIVLLSCCILHNGLVALMLFAMQIMKLLVFFHTLEVTPAVWIHLKHFFPSFNSDNQGFIQTLGSDRQFLSTSLHLSKCTHALIPPFGLTLRSSYTFPHHSRSPHNNN